MVKKYLLLIVLLTTFSCNSGYPELDSSINAIDPLLTKNESLYVFDEESCSVCFDNLLTLSQKKDEFTYHVLYATTNIERYSYKNSQLWGFFDEEKITPVQYSIIEVLRNVTDTYKGNYEVVFENGQVVKILNF